MTHVGTISNACRTGRRPIVIQPNVFSQLASADRFLPGLDFLDNHVNAPAAWDGLLVDSSIFSMHSMSDLVLRSCACIAYPVWLSQS